MSQQDPIQNQRNLSGNKAFIPTPPALSRNHEKTTNQVSQVISPYMKPVD